jgi:hypothetical protein
MSDPPRPTVSPPAPSGEALEQAAQAILEGRSRRSAFSIRPSVLLFVLVVCGFSGWYFYGGGRNRIEAWITRLSLRGERLSAHQALEQVRNAPGGAQGMTVVERLQALARNLADHGIEVRERRWDCVDDPRAGAWRVSCTLRGPAFETEFVWHVDRRSGAVTPANGPARALDALAADGSLADGSQGSFTPRRGDADIVLVGVVAAKSGTVALLRTAQGTARASVGQKVSGWTVMSIHPRSQGESTIVLSRGNHERELRMPAGPVASHVGVGAGGKHGKSASGAPSRPEVGPSAAPSAPLAPPSAAPLAPSAAPPPPSGGPPPDPAGAPSGEPLPPSGAPPQGPPPGE